MYVVHGDEILGSQAPNTSVLHSVSPGVLSSYGAYTGPTANVPPPRTQVAQRRKSNFRKTVALVSLTSPNPNKPSTSKSLSHLDYKVITQVVVSLEVGHCSPSLVAELVRQQVGFEVVLLDSKCFPILESETTAATDFWKSNRKVLAASKSLYVKLTGSSANPRRANSEIYSDDDGSNPPQPKRCCLSETKLDKILHTIETFQKRADLSDIFLGVFECVICKDTMQRPQFSPCCRRVVGCQQCINRWFEEHNICPHCSTTSAKTNYVDVRGMDEVLAAIRALHHDSPAVEERESQSDSDFDLPAVNFRSSNTD